VSEALPANSGHASPSRPGHMLSFDVEEYFQVEAAAARLPAKEWELWPNRLAPAVDQVLNLLDEYRVKATFFVLGWVAERQPGIVRRIACAGHEIASHGVSHRMLHGMTPQEFRGELTDSRSRLEDLGGRPVVGFRAPTFSVTTRTSWALDVLAETGFLYDSSIFPIRHDRYGVPGAPRWAHWARGPGGGRILEIPPLVLRIAGWNLPIGGGGYLRLFPVRLATCALRAAERAGWPGMIYVHPWELDPGQPALPMSRLSRWRHHVGLSRTDRKLRHLLRHFAFHPVRDLLPSLQVAEAEEHSYGPKTG
jgi:polysaccharide deacetylase family protein (PEP-CTERM system associated)